MTLWIADAGRSALPTETACGEIERRGYNADNSW
jgi:hypothetical protein